MKKYIIFIAIAMMLYAIEGFGQPAATIGFAEPVNPNTGYDQTEVSISVNKTNPTNLLISTNVDYDHSGDNGQNFYASTDGGMTWPIPGNNDDELPNGYPTRGDPSTAFDARGFAYITGMGGNQDGYKVEFSENLGVDWSSQFGGALTYGIAYPNPCGVGCFDKEMTAIVDEMQTSSFANFYYCAWTDNARTPNVVKINRSTDLFSTLGAFQFVA